MELLFDFPCPNIKSSLFLSTYTTLIENKHFPLLLSQSQDGERFSASMYQKIYHPAASAENASTDVAQHSRYEVHKLLLRSRNPAILCFAFYPVNGYSFASSVPTEETAGETRRRWKCQNPVNNAQTFKMAFVRRFYVLTFLKC